MAKTTKGERTRAAILGTALDMFREHGYEATTMRAIAEKAAVSLGNAYYYFTSKEHLIQAFYAHMHEEHLQASESALVGEKNFRQRLLQVMRARIDTMMPVHRFAGVLFRTAADPRSPLNPWSEASGPVREESTALFAEVVHGSSLRVHASLKDELPGLLWLYQMGIVLFWIYDTSPDCRRTYRLAEHTVDLVARLIALANLPPMRPVVRSALALLTELRGDSAELEGVDPPPANGSDQPPEAGTG